MRSPEQMIEDYIRQVKENLPHASPREKQELVAEIRSHLEEEVSRSEDRSSAAILNMLERFGDPEEIAQGLSDTLDDSVPVDRPRSYPPTWLVIGLTVFLWPAGIILAWLSPAWEIRHKAVATLIPIVAFGILLLFSVAAFAVYSGDLEVVVTESWEVVYGDGHEAGDRWSSVTPLWVPVVVLFLLASPLLSGVYLAFTRRPGF